MAIIDHISLFCAVQAELAERRRVQREKDEQLRLQRKQQEKERWWTGAETFKPRKKAEQHENVAETETRKDYLLSRYTADYSKWGSWVPSDDVSREEELTKLQAEEERKNKEFEANNPEFCKQFMQDMEERKKVSQKKQESADILRIKGNRHFKAKDFARSLEFYMDALKESPFDGKLVLNIAQAHIKLNQLDDAEEFLARTLFLEPNNVKALSRKAFLLGEKGHVEEASQVLSKALALEPSNADLVAQAKELESVRTERSEQARLHAAETTLMDEFACIVLLHRLVRCEAALPTAAGGDEERNRDAAVREAAEEVWRVTSAWPAERRSLARSFAYQCGAVQDVLDAIKQSIASNGARGDTQALLRICADWLSGQRSAQTLFVERKLFTPLKSLLAAELSPTSTAGSSASAPAISLGLLHAALEVVFALVCGDHCAKAKAAVLSDVQLLLSIPRILTCVCAPEVQKAAHAIGEHEEILRLCCQLLEIIAREKQAKDLLSRVTSSQADGLIGALALALQTICKLFELPKRQPPTVQQETDALVDAVLSALLGFSHVENLRLSFATPLPLSSTSITSSSSSGRSPPRTAIGAVLQLVLKHPHHLVNVLAVLMNASIASNEANASDSAGRTKVLEDINQQGGLELVMAEPATASSASTAYDLQCHARRAGLLSRLALLPSVQKQLLESARYRQLCLQLHTLTTISPEPSAGGGETEETHKWREELKGIYVRLLAALPVAVCENKETVVAVGRAEKLHLSLLRLFPMPRTECNEVTPTSVTLVPKDPLSPLLLGNAARCLIPYVDDAQAAREMFQHKQYLAVEKLICAMASCTDMRVRRNIAILLAKACKSGEDVRERVSYFRGLQMMIELQNQL